MTARPRLLLLVLLAATLAGPAGAQQAAEPPPAPSAAEADAENEIGRLLNQERARAGLPALEIDPKAVEAARSHARLMAERRHVEHQFPGEPAMWLRLAATGLHFDNAGENVAVDDDAASAHRDFLASVHHRENMLSPNYNVMGIGVAQGGGQLYVVEDFAYRTRQYSAVQAEDAVAASYLTFRSNQPGLAPQRREEPTLRALACAMARADKVGPGGLEQLPEARRLVSYTEGRPERLPVSLTDAVRGGSAKAFAVGACFARTPSHPEGVYWIQVALY